MSVAQENPIDLNCKLNGEDHDASKGDELVLRGKPNDKVATETMEVDNSVSDIESHQTDMEVDDKTNQNLVVMSSLTETPSVLENGKLLNANSCQPGTSKSAIFLNRNIQKANNTGAIKKGTVTTSIPTMEFTRTSPPKICQPAYDLKLVKYLELNQFIFNCPICFKDIKIAQGFVLKNCLHAVCSDCTLKYFKKNGGAGDLPCPLETDGCIQNMTKNEVNDLVLLINPPAPSKPIVKTINASEVIKKSGNKEQSFDALTVLLDVDLIPNPEAFNCKICFEEIEALQGVRLQECLHDFCRDCLINTIKNPLDPTEILCPYADDNYKCGFPLQQREIKELLTTKDYYEYLRKTVETAEMNLKNAFHCKTPNCHYFWELEDRNFERPYAQCESCLKFNCFDCETIHHPQTCAEYKNRITDNKSMVYVDNIVNIRKAMKCPNCKAVIEKTDGCDGIKCHFCKTMLCWATKGPRWGPKGEGDRSGGCGCDFKHGRPCVPECSNCH